jgi:hypothetical protein
MRSRFDPKRESTLMLSISGSSVPRVINHGAEMIPIKIVAPTLILALMVGPSPAITEPTTLLCSGRVDQAAWTYRGQNFPPQIMNLRDVIVVVDLVSKTLQWAPELMKGASVLPITAATEFTITVEAPHLDDGKPVGLKKITLNRISGEMVIEDTGSLRSFGRLRCEKSGRRF